MLFHFQQHYFVCIFFSSIFLNQNIAFYYSLFSSLFSLFQVKMFKNELFHQTVLLINWSCTSIVKFMMMSRCVCRRCSGLCPEEQLHRGGWGPEGLPQSSGDHHGRQVGGCGGDIRPPAPERRGGDLCARYVATSSSPDFPVPSSAL